MEEEQIFTIPLRGARKTQKNKRAPKASSIVKEFLEKHVDAEEIKISSDLNELIWAHGIENPPSKIRVRVNKLSDEEAEAEPLE